MKIAIDKLVVTKDNPRTTKASAASHQALVASMGTHGLIQPIVVRENGTPGNYQVIAGSRRLAAAQELGWLEVECVENDAEYGISELGTAENMMREAMHPLDECDAISRLVVDGESVDDVAARFGQTSRWVEQRMKLVELEDGVKKCFRNGMITMAAAQAFTLADHKTQKDYLAKAKQPALLEADAIIRAFTKGSYDAKNALFKLEDYPQASIRRDLFGEQILLDDRMAYEKLQKIEIAAIKAMLEGEGWGEVLTLWNGADYKLTGKYVKAEGRILKEARSKHACIITYSPASGAVIVDKGWALRTDTKKVKPGKTPDKDSTDPDDVVAKTADELSDTQRAIVGAFQTAGLELAISEGDVHLALLTLLGPLLDRSKPNNNPAWASGRAVHIRYEPINDMIEQEIEPVDDEEAKYTIPSRNALGDMTVLDLAPLLCNAALRVMSRLPSYNPDATKALKAAEISWMGFDEGFLRRYRTDQLVDLAGRLKLDSDGLGKAELVKMICNATKDMDVDRILKFEE